jgi:cytochrome oxidase Cu insertion factor (SCO1/SenC/PrrC family)
MNMKFFSYTLILLLLLSLVACGSSGDDGISVGDSAPDFSLTDSDGNQVSLSDYHGQPVLLFFHMAGG